jgi:hypothetical protein
MPLPLPNLDERRWSDLVEEGRALIPRHAPEWTDHNVHDPGITLLELFAWLTETSIYRLNRVPERHRLKFLALIGFAPRPPQPARTVFTFAPEAGTPPFLVPAGMEFEVLGPGGEAVLFRTLRDLDVAPAMLEAVLVESADGDLKDRTADWLEGLPLTVLGANPRPGAAFYLGFSQLPTGSPLALAFRFQGPGNDAEARARLLAEAAGQQAGCRRVLPDVECPDAEAEPSRTLETVLLHHSVRLAWETHTGDPAQPWQELEPLTGPERPGTGQVRDDTRALTLDGVVELNLPPSTAETTLGPVTSQLFWVRCRLASGAYDAPPALVDVAANAVVAEQAVPVHQRYTIPVGVSPTGTEPAPGTVVKLGELGFDTAGNVAQLAFDAQGGGSDTPELLFLEYSAPDDPAAAEPTAGWLTLGLVSAGVGDGRPWQQVLLPDAPLVLETARLFTVMEGKWLAWQRRADLDASERTDPHYTLDPTSGVVTFGDGERGRTPARGALVLAAYHATRAVAGSVEAGGAVKPAGTPRTRTWLEQLEKAGLTDLPKQLPDMASNWAVAQGGVDAELLEDAIGRAVAIQHAHERLQELCARTECQTLDQLDRGRVLALEPPTRAVNALDIERLTLSVPGTRIARARAWAGLHPAFPCLQAPGVVTVVVLPDTPGPHPEPSRGLLSSVRRYLDRRRALSTRLEVVGPHYLEVQVTARVRTRPFTNRARVEGEIRARLDRFLDPRQGGPDGRGWPFGRDVYRSELLQLIDDVPGVDHVEELRLQGGSGEPQCGNLTLCPTWLVTPGRHQIEVVGG